MNKRPLLAVLLCLAAAPVPAQDVNEGSFWKQLKEGEESVKKEQAGYRAKKEAKARAAQAAKPAKDQAAIDKTLEAMNDGNEVGGLVAQFLKDNGVKVQLDAKLPDYPRVLGPAIARQASGMMLSGMPDCSEKLYMSLSLQVRVWLELGGDKSQLPVIEPLNKHKDEALSKEYKLWLDNGSEMALYRLGEAAKKPSVMELIDKQEAFMRAARLTPKGLQEAQDKLEALNAANKRFVDFLLSENEWRKVNSFRLQ